MTNEYIISGGQDGKSRLKILSDVLYTHTRSLLATHGLSEGKAFLDMGCGGGFVSFMASEMVGKDGRVTAVDFDREILALASHDAKEQGLQNIEFHNSSADAISYSNEFDIAYARFLLSHLKDPAKVLNLMVQSAKPGGKVIVEDIHFAGHFCHPHNAAFYQYVDYFVKAATNNGHNPEIGPSLLHLFHQAGLKDVGFDVIQPTFNTGPGKWMAYITLERIKNTLIKQDIASLQTINTMLAELEAFTKNEHTIISLPRIFRVWGVRD